MSLQKQVTGRLKLDEQTNILNPLLIAAKINIDLVNKTVSFEYTATITGLQAGRNTPPLDYSTVTTAAVPTVTHLNTIINDWISKNLV